MEKEKVFSLRIPIQYYEKLKERADKNRRSINLEIDPTLRVNVVPENKNERKAVNVEGLQKLLAPENWKNEIIRQAVLTAAIVGLRAGEIRGLRWEDLDPERGIIRIVRSITDLDGVKPPKWGKPRVTAYPKVLQRELEPRRGAGYVFAVCTTGPLSYKTLLKAMKEATEKAGLPGLTLHGLRHSIQTILRGAGLHDEIIRASFGWSSPGVQENYTHRDLYDLSIQSEIIDNLFSGK